MAKKKGAKGTIIGIICVIIIAAIIVAVVYFMQGDKKISDLLNIFNKTELTQEQKEEDNKAKEQEQKLLEEIAKDVEDKKPEDIIIPAGATEEEKQELQQEKEYWTVVNDFKDKANQYLAEYYIKGEGGLGPSEMQYGFKTIRKINNIFAVDSGGVAYIYCDYIYDKELNNGETVLNQCSAIIMVWNNNIRISTDPNLSDIINLLNDSNTKFSIEITMCFDYEYLDEFVANHVVYEKRFENYKKAGKDYKIIQCGHGEEYQNGRPTEFKVLYERDFGDFSTYYYLEIKDLTNFSKEEWDDYVLNQKTFEGLFASRSISFESLNINFEELNEKYQQK